MSDNFHFDITGASLEDSLKIAFSIHKKAVGWNCQKIDGHYALVLYWFPADLVNPFPAPLTIKEVVPIVEKWLNEASYGVEPDHDGCNSKGWRVFNESWARVGGEAGAFVGIQPAWLMHGK